ncbi:hypothetical protein FDENT_10917 [Fusarium denticulatum]|uniref:Uncharacterized protein n=1 Tax=Fusarium denticulatum TaxID=48507 RepID=A0A8H5TJQ6_9HYPO|nr:hypothetical protein FDENT_10917 [Fusarium denticulatum]
MWLPTTADTPKLIDALRKLGVDDSTSDSASAWTIRTFETIYYFTRTSPESNSLSNAISTTSTCTSVTLDYIYILEAEVDKALDTSDGMVSGAQAITEDPAFEGFNEALCRMVNGPDLDLSFSFTLEVDQNNSIYEGTTRFQPITASFTASLHQAKVRGESACAVLLKCATLANITLEPVGAWD